MRKRRRRRTKRELDGVEREPSGRPSRRSPREDMTKIVKWARQRIYGLTDEQSAHQDGGTVQGRMWLRKQITREQCDAADRYVEKHSRAMAAIKAPASLKVSNRAGDGGDLITEEYVEWAVRAVAEYRILRQAVIDVDKAAESALDMMVINQQDHSDDPDMVAAVRFGLAILVDKLGL